MSNTFNLKDVFCLVGVIPLNGSLFDGLGQEGSIRFSYLNERSSKTQYVNGGFSTGYNCNTIGEITFSIHTSSALYTAFKALALSKTTFPIVIKNLNQTTDICLMDSASIKTLGETKYENMNAGFTDVVFHGGLTIA
jgi:hypothetical protein